MRMSDRTSKLRLFDRAVVGGLVLLALLLIGVQVSQATEIIPSIGLTKPVEGDGNADLFGGLAFRGDIGFLKPEVAVAYRQESRFDDALKVRMWPVTASLYLAPIPNIYAGAGVGWYNITFDYDHDRVPATVEDRTTQEFGVHLGGGFMVPLGPSLGVDLNGRYVMLQEQDSRLVPERFDPDFWTTSVGLAFRF